MEVHLTAETEKQLKDLSAMSGRATDELVEDAMAVYEAGRRSGAWVKFQTPEAGITDQRSKRWPCRCLVEVAGATLRPSGPATDIRSNARGDGFPDIGWKCRE